MTQLLVVGTSIFAQAPLVQTVIEITATDAIYPLSIIPGWQIVDVALPDDFTCQKYQWVSGALALAPDDPQAVIDAKAAQTDAMSLACENAIYAGFQSSALGAAYSYPTGDKDQTNLLGSVAMSQLPAGQVDGWTCNFWCGDVTGAWAMRAHTAAQIQEVGSDAYSTKIGYINQNIALATQIAEATTLAQIAAIVWS